MAKPTASSFKKNCAQLWLSLVFWHLLYFSDIWEDDPEQFSHLVAKCLITWHVLFHTFLTEITPIRSQFIGADVVTKTQVMAN